VGDEFIIAIALVLVIEGGLYALFPDGMKRMALSIERIPASTLRSVGLFVATLGVGVIWLAKR